MSWRFFASLLLTLAIVAGLGLAGAAVYQAGFLQGAASTGTVTIAPYGAYGWHPGGFGFFGFLGALLFLFLLFGLARAAFGGPRRWGGPGHGRGWGDRGDPSRHAWEDRARTAFDDWHRRAHEGAAPDDATRNPPV